MKNLSQYINESASPRPINHKIEGDNFILIFENETDCQEAKQYYSSIHVRTTSDKKGLTMPIVSVARFLVNKLQSQAYNPAK